MAERKAEHTPGPWRAELAKNQSNLIYIVPEVAPDTYIADIWPDDRDCEGPFTETNWADARLIAAAPDLLKALELILESARDGRDVPEWLMERLVTAEAAIHKTEGGE